jgi:hypothetical protein
MELRGGGKSSNREAPVLPGARRVDRAATSSSFRPWWREQLAPATGSKSTDAENRNHRLRRALHRIDLGRLNRHLSGETFQTYFFGPRCPEPPTAANQQSAVERMKAIAALAMLMRRPRRHRRRQAHSPFLLHSGPVLRRQIQPTGCRGMGARPLGEVRPGAGFRLASHHEFPLA